MMKLLSIVNFVFMYIVYQGENISSCVDIYLTV